MISSSNTYATQKRMLLTVMKINHVKGMLLSLEYGHERSQAILRKELKKLQALRDKLRKTVRRLVDREYAKSVTQYKDCI